MRLHVPDDLGTDTYINPAHIVRVFTERKGATPSLGGVQGADSKAREGQLLVWVIDVHNWHWLVAVCDDEVTRDREVRRITDHWD